MVTWFRAVFWALSFGVFFHISLDEHHGIFISLVSGAFWTTVLDRLVTSSIGPRY